MREVLKTGHPEIDMIMEYLMESSGKMLRPRLVYLTASFYPHDPQVMKDTAVAVELIHLASLVHDDVIDQALTRRGRESMNSRWGNQTSVLAGDYLFATAFNLINHHGLPEVMENVTQTIQLMCGGEIKQMSLAYNLNISQEEYLDKTFRKTACLFASSCKVGTQINAMPLKEAALLEQFGLCLGYAYQIIDDILDFVSDSTVLGKPAGNDLMEGNVTLPLIIALKNSDYGPLLRQILDAELDSSKLQQITQILIESKAIEFSLSLSRRFLHQALVNLDSLPAAPAVEELKELTAYLMEGYYKNLIRLSPADNKEVVGRD